jgi:N-terminal glutamine amidase
MQSNVDNSQVTSKFDDIAVSRGDASPTAASTALSAPSDHALRVPFYCEENVWRIAYRKLHRVPPLKDILYESSTSKYFVLFISNERTSVPMFHQRASSAPAEKPCVWDYHVLLLEVDGLEHKVLVYDVDTTLVSYPIPLSDYLSATFARVEQCFPEYAPLFRLVPAELYLQYFASDRCHMYNTKKKAWNEPPPHYLCILPPGVEIDRSDHQAGYDAPPSPSIHSNLQYYLDFSGRSAPNEIPVEALGSILTLQQLREYPFLVA